MKNDVWMRCRIRVGVAVLLAIAAAAAGIAQQPPAAGAQKTYPYPPVRDQRGVIPPGPKVAPWPAPPLGDGPFVFETYEQRNIRIVVVTKGLSHPWSLAFLPDGSMLMTERVGRLRIVRKGVLDPNPVAGTPAVVSRGTMAGLMDIALHPRFNENRWIYISYHKPAGKGRGVDGTESDLASNSILRGTWNGTR